MTQDELRDWLVENQRYCPGCGYPVHVNDHLHHVFVRRLKQVDDLLWTRLNIALVCPTCHVPEAPSLNLNCALQKWSMGFSPQDVRDWIASLPLKVKPGMRRFFLEAEQNYYGRDWRGQPIA